MSVLYRWPILWRMLGHRRDHFSLPPALPTSLSLRLHKLMKLHLSRAFFMGRKMSTPPSVSISGRNGVSFSSSALEDGPADQCLVAIFRAALTPTQC